MIIYRDPDVTSATLLRSFCVAFWCSLIGTLAETATILSLYVALFHKWTLTMKVLIPVLHCVFTAAQLWGEKCTWDLWRQEKEKAKRARVDSEESFGIGEQADIVAIEVKQAEDREKERQKAEDREKEGKQVKRTSVVEITEI